MLTAFESNAYVRFHDTRNKLSVILNDLATVAQARGDMILDQVAADRTPASRSLAKREVAELLRQRAKIVAATTPFRVAVVGEFSRGKSTLINSLLEREILTSDFRPNTAARTVLRYGEHEQFRVNYVKELGIPPVLVETTNLKRDLAAYTSDSAVTADYRALLKGETKSLAEQVAEVEVWCASDFLKAKQMEIIDTPGLGSVFQAHKAITYEVIPTVDATLFLVQADPGLGENEILFLRYVREYVNQIFFVLTKKDIARSPDELEGMLEFVRATIEENVDLKVENLFPISAIKALQGDEAGSGFQEFLPALEEFLVKSKGVARLQAPHDLACFHWKRLYDAVQSDFEMLDQDLSTLRAELDRLLKDEKRIEKARDKLLRQVDDQIGELSSLATDGMGDYLPKLIQEEVEKAIDELDSLSKFGKVGDYIQPVMKDVVLNWLAKKESRFQSSAERLRRHVEQDLQDILETIRSGEAKVGSGMTVDVALAGEPGGLWASIGPSLGRAALGSGLGFAAGTVGVVILGEILGLASAAAFPPLMAITLLVATLSPAAKELLSFKANMRKRIKRELLKPIPGNTVDAYQAIAEGYSKSGEHKPGVRKVVEDTFHKWGNQLKEGISLVITNNLDARLTQLRHKIHEQESGQQNREQELSKYAQQKADLESLEARLDQVLKSISQLSAGHFEAEALPEVAKPAEQQTQAGEQAQVARRIQGPAGDTKVSRAKKKVAPGPKAKPRGRKG